MMININGLFDLRNLFPAAVDLSYRSVFTVDLLYSRVIPAPHLHSPYGQCPAGKVERSLGWVSKELRAVFTALLTKRASQGLSERKTAVLLEFTV